MENQVPEDIVKEEFNRVLEAVQEVSKERTGGLEGQIVDVLFEEINAREDRAVGDSFLCVRTYERAIVAPPHESRGFQRTNESPVCICFALRKMGYTPFFFAVEGTLAR